VQRQALCLQLKKCKRSTYCIEYYSITVIIFSAYVTLGYIYIRANGRITHELERNGRGLFKESLSIWLEGLRKTTNIYVQDIRCFGWDPNCVLPEQSQKSYRCYSSLGLTIITIICLFTLLLEEKTSRPSRDKSLHKFFKHYFDKRLSSVFDQCSNWQHGIQNPLLQL
jgi:hypothetical protein